MTAARRTRGSGSSRATTGVGSGFRETIETHGKGAAVARTIPMPSKEELPDGPRRAFVTELRRYYRVARPSLREISQAIERHTDPRLNKVTASAETVRREQERLYAVFRVLCDMAEVDPDAERWDDDGGYNYPDPRATGSTSGGYGTPLWRTSPTPRPFPGRPRLRPSPSGASQGELVGRGRERRPVEPRQRLLRRAALLALA